MLTSINNSLPGVHEFVSFCKIKEDGGMELDKAELDSLTFR